MTTIYALHGTDTMWFFDCLALFFLAFYILASILWDITPVGYWIASNHTGTGGDGEEVDGAVAMAMYGSME